MKLGIVGLPNVGKSTLFNAITNTAAEAANYPFCTIEPNVGVVPVPDERLFKLAEIYNPKKITPAMITFVDIAGLVKGASKGEGLGNKFLSHVREMDAIIHVVRCFDDPNIVHVEGSADPLRDIEIINIELSLSDLETVGRRIDRVSKMLKGDPKLSGELELLNRLRVHLDAGKTAASFDCTPKEAEILDGASLITRKPVIFAANLDEAGMINYAENKYYKAVSEYALKNGAAAFPVCARLEEEIAALADDEKLIFLEDIGLKDSGLTRLVKESYSLLGLLSFLTAGEPEVRAWTITKGTKAPQAAGKIHSDIERGFIRAEIISYSDLIENGSAAAVKEKGLMRSEGRDYVMREGDVVLFRFNV